MGKFYDIKEARITVRIEENGRGITYKDFNSAQDFANFLKEESEVAKALDYVPKPKQVSVPTPPVLLQEPNQRQKRPTARQVNRNQPTPISKKDEGRIRGDVQGAINVGFLKDMPEDWDRNLKK